MSVRTKIAARFRGSLFAMVFPAALAAMWPAVGPASTVARAEPGSSFAAVYVTTPPLTNVARAVPDAVYRLPQAGGVYVRLVWNVVEPGPDRYDWTTLDAQLDRAAAAGKKLAIGIGTGAFTPGWIYKRGVPGATFVIAPHGGRNGRCRTVVMPAPWAPRYQGAFGDLMAALAAHLKARAGAYEAAKIIKMTAINERSEETRMGVSRGGIAVPGACAQSDAVSTWRSLGYRPSKIVQAWTNMAMAVDRAFPDKLIAMPILETNDFPPIDENGDLASLGDPDALAVKRALILAGLRIFKGHFAVQWNGLQSHKVSPSVLWAAARGAVVGWQTNEHRGADGSACGVPGDSKAACTEAGYEAILSHGLDAGARYLEIWPADALEFPAVVGRANLRLQRDTARPAPPQ